MELGPKAATAQLPATPPELRASVPGRRRVKPRFGTKRPITSRRSRKRIFGFPYPPARFHLPQSVLRLNREIHGLGFLLGIGDGWGFGEVSAGGHLQSQLAHLVL